jgi:hypothetical protein
LISDIKGRTSTEGILEDNAERIFERKTEEVRGDLRKPRNEELHKLYSWSYIIRMMKSRRMRWSGHVARVEEKRNAYRILVGKPYEKTTRKI